ncbi:hypothetical protein [uncultured Roseobacter sp.]|uniref:hypothetical protein n=1 Tax=uncultured Roseobacter sp. TaxID=114847 RepID=UPI00261551C1|nr:hypothetical protein [uncultured Roseobacter sp.]
MRNGLKNRVAWAKQCLGQQKVKFFFCRITPILTILVSLVTVPLLIAIVLFAFAPTKGGLYIIGAETSRIQYQVNSPERARMMLYGVNVKIGNSFVVRTGDFPKLDNMGPTEIAVPNPPEHCFWGELSPLNKTFVELSVEKGVQQLRLFADPMSPIESQGPLATLTLPGIDFKIEGQEEEGSRDDSLVLDDQPLLEDIVLAGEIQITPAPECNMNGLTARVFGFPTRGFATLAEPAYIDGPGELGRRSIATKRVEKTVDWLGILRASPVTTVAGDLDYVSGEVEVFVRPFFCTEKIVQLLGPKEKRTGCKDIYRLDSEPLKIPSGSAIRGIVRADRQDETSVLYGQVYFDGAVYQVSGSTEAEGLEMLRPGSGATRESSNVLSVSLLERVALEPLLIILTTAFFTLLGILVGILQIENDKPDSKGSS